MVSHRLRALNYLARREHTRLELSRKLMRYGEAAEIEALLDDLTSEGLLSHARFIEAAHRVWYAKGYGPRWMLARFQQLGITSEMVTAWWKEEQPDWMHCARGVYEKKFSSPITSWADRARRMRFLTQRGFAQEIIQMITTTEGAWYECE